MIHYNLNIKLNLQLIIRWMYIRANFYRLSIRILKVVENVKADADEIA